ncbi:hypothetical protein RHS01_07903 [Rhizoctonia solani]|uniref:non-specific serine/threonine protein kinase n=1 Tax=Rhizoctonia solani TaxID=456999 RepID=A0A8H7IA11_9AGAM|nr:hypothetical protein RHS01_07903 [Rhizoctonia solani]
MLPALIQLCVLAIVLCVAAEPFRRSSHASIQKFSKDLATAKRTSSSLPWRKTREDTPMVPHSVPGPSTAGQDVRLLDIVLAASVDGRFHALNRTTGELIWSMADDLAYAQSPRDRNIEGVPPMASQTPLYNLVRSDHRSLVDSEHVEESEETYVIEPQTGEVFLAELSPFIPPGDDERVFHSTTTTSLITIDLLTGRILGVYGEHCAWDNDDSNDDIHPSIGLLKLSLVALVHYHVSVYVKGRGVVQNLKFTKYGPNNVHRAIQAAWNRSPDSTYFQPSPDGRLYSFAKGTILTYVPTYPLIVAIFDAVYLPTRRDPILLLQPIPKLSDLSASLSLHSATPPILSFFSHVGKKQLPRIDDGGKAPNSYPLSDPDSSAERCYDLDCLTGTKWSQSARRSGLNRLIGEEHVLYIEGSAGVEDPPEDYPSHDIPQSRPDPPRTPKRPQTLPPDPTRTTRATNSTSHGRPAIQDKTPEATPSPRSGIRGVAREWLAAWASMGGVVLSTVMFGLGLGVRRGKLSLGPILLKLLGIKNDNSSPEPDAKPVVEEEDDEIPPPVPPKPYSFSRQDPYFMTSDSRPGVPLKDVPTTPPRRRIRPRVRGGVPSSASVPILPTLNPTGQLAASKSTGDVNAERGLVEEPEGQIVDEKKEPENTETEVEGAVEEANTPGKKRVRRGRRGKGRGKGASTGDTNKNGVETEGVLSEGSESFIRVEKTEKAPVVPKSSLVVSEEVLGYGSHGTVVYKGKFQGRSVAVKRLLHDFVTLARATSRELPLHSTRTLSLLTFRLVERPQMFPDVVGSFDPKRALSQVTAGLRHLHALKIVHRDIKPQNILLDVDQTSFMPTAYGGAAAGTAGWRAPEILRGEVNVDMAALDVSNGGIGSSSGSGSGSATSGTRLTRSVDVFALGCLFFYVLSGGDHAFGDRFERDVNILRDEKRLDWLERLGEEGFEAIDLIQKMLSPDPKKRPDTTKCLTHPFFWTPSRRLAFLQDASDRFEIMERDPREPGLVALETGAVNIIGNDWQRRLTRCSSTIWVNLESTT